jgi:protein-tyrosine phosphatase
MNRESARHCATYRVNGVNLKNRWIDLDGAVNVRDLGGIPTRDGGVTRHGRILRADNLQGLTPADVARLVGELKVRHVVDLRSTAEVMLEGPGPLTAVPEVTHHHLTLFPEGGRRTDVEADTIDADRVLPWHERQIDPELRVTGFYYGYLRDRPDAVVRALRTLARDDGAASGERLELILRRLRASDTYRDDLDSRPADDHMPRPRYIEQFLAVLDDRFGGPLGWLERHGWTDGDTQAMRARLLD